MAKKAPAAATAMPAAAAGAALRVARDPVTGALRPLTPEEARQLLGRRPLAVAEPQVVTLPDGTKMMRLGPDQASLSVARRNPDGTFTSACVHGTDEARAFLEAAPAPAPAPRDPRRSRATMLRRSLLPLAPPRFARRPASLRGEHRHRQYGSGGNRPQRPDSRRARRRERGHDARRSSASSCSSRPPRSGAALLTSTVTIRVSASFAPLQCTATTGTLGSTFANEVLLATISREPPSREPGT